MCTQAREASRPNVGGNPSGDTYEMVVQLISRASLNMRVEQLCHPPKYCEKTSCRYYEYFFLRNAIHRSRPPTGCENPLKVVPVRRPPQAQVDEPVLSLGDWEDDKEKKVEGRDLSFESMAVLRPELLTIFTRNKV